MRHERVRSMGSGAPAKGKRAVLKQVEDVHASFDPMISFNNCSLVAKIKKRPAFTFLEGQMKCEIYRNDQ